MRVVRASLLRGRPTTAAHTGVRVEDLLWAHAAPATGVEHIRARPTPAGIDVFLFFRADTDTAALELARDLLVRARGFLGAHGLSTALPGD